jgi:DNA primase
MEYEGLGFSEAVERLAKRLGVEVEYESGSGFDARQNRSIKEKVYHVNEKVSSWWHRLLMNDASAEVARDYLAGRRVSGESIQNFQLGFAPDSWDEVRNWGKSHGFDEDLLETAGLLVRKEGSSHRYSRFRGRLMFPIHDMQGRIAGFSARVLNAEDRGAKYINSPETPVFQKNQVLFGLHRARKPILDHKQAILCEGQLDAITLHEYGFPFSVAPQGTAFGEGHVRILKRLASEVILCFDSDSAGQKAAVRVWEELLRNDMEVSVISIPKGHDPDSFLKEFGAEAFRSLLDRRRNYFDFLIEFWGRELDLRTDSGRKELSRRMGEVSTLCPNPLVIDEIARKTALATHTQAGIIREAWTRYQFQKHRKSEEAQSGMESGLAAGGKPSPGVDDETTPLRRIEPADLPRNESWLLQLILNVEDEEFQFNARKWINRDWITSTDVREILELWINGFENGSATGETAPRDTAGWLKEMEDPALATLCRSIMVKAGTIREPLRQLEDVLLKLRNRALDFQIGELTRKASDPDLSHDEVGILLRMQQNLREQKKAPVQDCDSATDEADMF